MATPSHRPFALMLLMAAATILWACSTPRGELARLDLTVPGPTALELDAPRALLAGTGRLNTYARFTDGRALSPTSRTIVQAAGIAGAPVWRAHDSRGNWVEFAFAEDGGLDVTRAHNSYYGSWIVPGGRLTLARERMPQGELLVTEVPFATWADDWTTRTGQLRLETWFAGVEDATTTLGLIPGCARVDSRIRVSVWFGIPFTAELTQRQWLHAEYGEVLRDVDGSFGAVGLALRRFSSRQVLVASRGLEPGDIESLGRGPAGRSREETVRSRRGGGWRWRGGREGG